MVLLDSDQRLAQLICEKLYLQPRSQHLTVGVARYVAYRLLTQDCYSNLVPTYSSKTEMFMDQVSFCMSCAGDVML
jgi:hypothetical protein